MGSVSVKGGPVKDFIPFSVERVAYKGMTHMGHMYPDLVGASGEETKTDQGVPIFQDSLGLKAGTGILAIDGIYGHFQRALGTGTDGNPDLPAGRRRNAGYDSKIFLFQPALLPVGQKGSCKFVFSEDHRSGGILVQASYGADGSGLSFGPEIGGNHIGKGVLVMYAAGMDQDPGRLIYDQKICILIENVQRKVKRQNVPVGRDVLRLQLQGKAVALF